MDSVKKKKKNKQKRKHAEMGHIKSTDKNVLVQSIPGPQIRCMLRTKEWRRACCGVVAGTGSESGSLRAQPAFFSPGKEGEASAMLVFLSNMS